MTPDQQEAEAPQQELPIKPILVALDETMYWFFEEGEEGKIKKISTIYLFDANLITHICSFQGSYWLVYIDTRVECADGLSDEEVERLREKYEDLGREYASDDYFDEHSIDHIVARGDKDCVKVLAEEPFDINECTRDEAFEAVREYCQGNSQL